MKACIKGGFSESLFQEGLFKGADGVSWTKCQLFYFMKFLPLSNLMPLRNGFLNTVVSPFWAALMICKVHVVLPPKNLSVSLAVLVPAPVADPAIA